jgi:squalene synthase HpnC
MVRAFPSDAEPTEAELAVKERSENFPVALRLLPRSARTHLRAIYDVARLIDDVGDEADGDRTAQLLDLRRRLDQVWSDDPPRAGALGRLVPTVRACDLGPQEFHRLIEANQRDQTVHRYRRRSDLLDYCTLSADPVGRLVLAVFRATTVRTVALSDLICTALQILEHCQDVGEDYRRGRIYLPLEDLERFGVSEAELAASSTTESLQQLIQFETRYARARLDEGAPLIGLLHGPARLAVAGYLAGGYATADALRRSGGQVLPAGPRPRRREVLRHAIRLLARARAGRAAA